MTNESLEEKKAIKTMREYLGMPPLALPLITLIQETKAPFSPNLPVEEIPPKPLAKEDEGQMSPALEQEAEKKEEEGVAKSKFFWVRHYLRYPLIFLLALGFFYVVLNFGAVSKQISSWAAVLTKENARALTEPEEYRKWTKKYYVFLNDFVIMQLASDPDNDGLKNIEEFYLGTNPLVKDTDGDGYDDGREVLNGYNPLYEGRLTALQQNILAEQKIDMESIASRKALEKVAGERAGLPLDNFQIDTTKSGYISLPKLGVEAPIIWSRDFREMEEDLKSGVAHHPQTPYPGEYGTASVHGHSSGNLGDGDFKTVFTKLNFLEGGDEILVTVYGKNGEVRRLRFVVQEKKVFAKSDPKQFEQKVGYFLNLSTSWPIGTAQQRYVVITELVGL